MFDQSRLQKVLVQYKKDFVPKHWDEEKYKWEAVKCFQDNWDIKAANFKDMLSRSLSKTYNLLSSMNNFPADMILGFAKTAPEDVRSMYIDCLMKTKMCMNESSILRCRRPFFLKNTGTGPNSIISMKMPLRPIYGCAIRISTTSLNSVK